MNTEIARMALAALSRRARASLLAEFGASTPRPLAETEARILRRAEVAKRLGRSKRAVDLLAQQGILKRVHLPGRTRSMGYRESDVAALVGG